VFTGAVPQGEQEGSATFESLGLEPALLASVSRIGFERPTPIQTGVIPHALEGRDVIGLAQTGSGKTAAFALPMAQRLMHGRGVRGLILCPTREIALQTKAFLDVVGRDHQLETSCLIGGVALGPQIQELRRDPDIVVATPGRLYDHMERRNVRLDGIQYLVLDEGDHMLDLGFLPQILRILQSVPDERQTMLFSATLPQPIERLAQQFLTDPTRVDLRPPGRAAEGLEHRLYLVSQEDRRAALLALAESESGSMLVFLERKVDAEWAFRQLEKEGFPVERIHSDRSQRQRVAALGGLREGRHRILLATNIAARGIDIPIIEHIVNFGMPDTADDYIHRGGRTARGSAGGTVSTIATWKDKEAVKAVEKAIGRPLPRCTLDGIEPYVERKSTIRGRQRLRRRLL
jgi:ATP-dependent RNA helicase RhlE